jgi:hypothetical protein
LKESKEQEKPIRPSGAFFLFCETLDKGKAKETVSFLFKLFNFMIKA